MRETTAQTAAHSGSASPDRGVDCSSRFLLDQIADKWSVLILAALCEKPLRFNELKRCLDGITQKALTQALRRLERNGILARRVIPSSQVAVEYSITPLGKDLLVLMIPMWTWVVQHAEEFRQCREIYDSNHASLVPESPRDNESQ